MLGNTMLQNCTVHCAHNFFLWEDREKREEKARRQRGRKVSLRSSTEKNPPLLMENQTLLLEYKILTCLSPAPAFASFTSIFFFFLCALLSGPERQKRMLALPFGKSWKHQRFCKRSPGNSYFWFFFRKTNYLQVCVLTVDKQGCLSGEGAHLSLTHLFAKSSACCSHCCSKLTFPWASRKHLNSQTSASTSPPKITTVSLSPNPLISKLKYVLAAWDAVKAVPALDSTSLLRPGYLRRSAAVGCKHPGFAA